jgi:dTDP-4-dehydrorhamnose reductase
MSFTHSSPVTLVVGCDGLIGGELLRQLERAGEAALGTTRRRELVDDQRLYLDLSEDVAQWRPPRPVSVAVLCAGVTKIEECRRDPRATARINVEAVATLARRLVASGAFVIYLSTNQVFDGTQAQAAPADPPTPQTEYGRQKVEVERQLLALADATAIVRLTKVVGPAMPLFEGWCAALRRGEAIHPFKDMVMAPIPLAFVVEVILRLAETRLTGIFQASGQRDVTFAQVAHHIAERIGARRELVQPISVRDAGIPEEAAPSHTTLDATELRLAFGLKPPDVLATIDAALGLQSRGTERF